VNDAQQFTELSRQQIEVFFQLICSGKSNEKIPEIVNQMDKNGISKEHSPR
jgi:hypothetical protein